MRRETNDNNKNTLKQILTTAFALFLATQLNRLASFAIEHLKNFHPQHLFVIYNVYVYSNETIIPLTSFLYLIIIILNWPNS